MITHDSFVEAVKDGNLREKMVAVLKRDFPRTQRETLEDIVHTALVVLARNIRRGMVVNHTVDAAAIQIAKTRAIDWHQNEANRRVLLQGAKWSMGRMYNPQVAVDYKIDLERAIMRSVERSDLQRACVMVLYAGFLPTDLASELNLGDKGAHNWLRQVYGAIQKVKKQMRRMGYRRLRA